MSERRLLLVDDDPISLAILSEALLCGGFEPVAVESAHQALELLMADPEHFSAVILDRIMPEMDGLELLRTIKAHASLCDLPVVMQTAASAPSEVTAGLEAGAYYYLTKPYDASMLLPVVHAALDGREERKRLTAAIADITGAFGYLRSGEFRIRTLAEGRALAVLLASAFPDSRRVVTGLTELLLNAVEHGNAGINYDQKTQLLAAGDWQAEVERRLASPEHAAKRVTALFARSDASIGVTIHDEGPGFEWRHYLTLAPDRAFDVHGRGIALARMVSFDSVEYRGRGNEVCALVNCSGANQNP